MKELIIKKKCEYCWELGEEEGAAKERQRMWEIYNELHKYKCGKHKKLKKLFPFNKI